MIYDFNWESLYAKEKAPYSRTELSGLSVSPPTSRTASLCLHMPQNKLGLRLALCKNENKQQVTTGLLKAATGQLWSTGHSRMDLKALDQAKQVPPATAKREEKES